MQHISFFVGSCCVEVTSETLPDVAFSALSRLCQAGFRLESFSKNLQIIGMLNHQPSSTTITIMASCSFEHLRPP